MFLCSALVLIQLTSCGGKAEVRSLEHRVARLEAAGTGDVEARVAELEAAAAAMEKAIAHLERQLRSATGRFDSMNDALDELTGRLEEIKKRLDRAPAGPAAPARVRRPDPQAVYAVPVAGSPVIGRADAKVTLVHAFEFACPYCERVRATIDQLRRDYGRDLRVVYKHFIVHPQVATIPAHAACAAHRQKQFLAMKEQIWEKGYNAGRDLGVQNMERIARNLGLDMREFTRDMNSARCRKRVRDDQALLTRLGTRGTPSFYINGRHLSGARPIAVFKQLIDEELAKANKAIRAGTPRRGYYDSLVRSGRTSL